MRRQSEQRSFTLEAQSIDRCSDYLDDVLGRMGVGERSRIRIRLTIEEALLHIRDHEGEQTEVTLIVGSAISGSYVRLEHEGHAFNPLGDIAEDDLGSNLFTAVGLQPHYSYVGRRNILLVPFPRSETNPAISLLIGMAAGIAMGVVGNLVLPQEVRNVIAHSFVAPVFDAWKNMLNALAAPVIFVTAMATMLNVRKIDERGGSHRRMVAQYFLLSFGVAALAVALSSVVFRTQVSSDYVGVSRIVTIVSGLPSAIPKHLLDPFITSNTPQLLFMAFVVGNAIIVLGERARDVARFVEQCNLVNSLITKWASRLVPALCGLLLAAEIWDNETDLLPQLWKPMLVSLLVCALFMVCDIVWTSARYHVPVSLLVKKLLPPFSTAFRTGTLDASYDEADFSCVRGLGVDQTYTDVALPQGLVLYMPASIMGTLAFTVFVAHVYGVETTLAWFGTAIVLDVLLFVATPPVPGANLLAFIALFQELGIPEVVFLDAMIFDILFGLFANAANQMMLQTQMIREADRMGMLKRARLRKPIG